MLVYDKYTKGAIVFKSVQVVEELPNQYMINTSNSPVKKWFAGKKASVT
ncbi:hypothetical protein O9929_10290 [Vibrio lentus]|nr:hypothetical protein [Vibrio lentus]